MKYFRIFSLTNILNAHNDPCLEDMSSSLTSKYRSVHFSENSCTWVMFNFSLQAMCKATVFAENIKLSSRNISWNSVQKSTDCDCTDNYFFTLDIIWIICVQFRTHMKTEFFDFF